MAKQNKMVSAIPRGHPRDGEGYVVEATRRIIPMPDGTQSVQVQIELNSAPVPDRRYQADVVDVRYTRGVIQLIFGQKTISGKSLRSIVIVNMSSMGALLFLRSCEQMREKFYSFVKTKGLLEALETIEEEPAQAVSLSANVILAAYSGRESCLDLYFASPYMMSRLPLNEKFAIEPIVRIMLTTGLSWAIIERLDELKSKFPPDELSQVEGLGSTQ